MNVCSACTSNAVNVSAAGSNTAINPITSQRSSIAEGRLYRLWLLLPTAVVWMCFAPIAFGSTGWTPATAAAKLKAVYATVDPKAAAVVQANIDQERAGCQCDTNARIGSLLASLKATQTAAKAQSATCRGAGRGVSGRYARFHCTVVVAGTFRAPPDYKLFTASVKVTVRARPFRVLAGWR